MQVFKSISYSDKTSSQSDRMGSLSEQMMSQSTDGHMRQLAVMSPYVTSGHSKQLIKHFGAANKLANKSE